MNYQGKQQEQGALCMAQNILICTAQSWKTCTTSRLLSLASELPQGVESPSWSPEARAVQQSCVFQHGKSSGIPLSAAPCCWQCSSCHHCNPGEHPAASLQIPLTLPGKAESRDLQRKPQGGSQSQGTHFDMTFRPKMPLPWLQTQGPPTPSFHKLSTSPKELHPH